jgi:hypothetical protein
MNSKSSSRNNTRGRLLSAALAGAVGLTLLLGSGAAHAQDNAPAPSPDGSMPCTPLGQDGPPTIPEETVIKVGDDYYQCIRGQWWKIPRAVMTVQPGVKTRGAVVSQGPVLNLAR